MNLLKELSIKTNRVYSECALYTLPVRMPKASKTLKELLGIEPKAGEGKLVQKKSTLFTNY